MKSLAKANRVLVCREESDTEGGIKWVGLENASERK